MLDHAQARRIVLLICGYGMRKQENCYIDLLRMNRSDLLHGILTAPKF